MGKQMSQNKGEQMSGEQQNQIWDYKATVGRIQFCTHIHLEMRWYVTWEVQDNFDYTTKRKGWTESSQLELVGGKMDTCKIGGRCIKTFRYYYLIVITLLRRHCKEKFLILFLTCRKTSYLRGFNCVSSLPPSIWHILHYDFSRFSKWIYDSRDNREERVFLDKLDDWSVLGWDKTILQYWKWNVIFIQRWSNLSHVFISKKWPSEHFQTRYESFNGTKVDLSSEEFKMKEWIKIRRKKETQRKED